MTILCFGDTHKMGITCNICNWNHMEQGRKMNVNWGKNYYGTEYMSPMKSKNPLVIPFTLRYRSTNYWNSKWFFNRQRSNVKKTPNKRSHKSIHGIYKGAKMPYRTKRDTKNNTLSLLRAQLLKHWMLSLSNMSCSFPS